MALLGLGQCRPPVQKQPHPQAGQGKPAQNETNGEWDLGIEYNRYLQEVVQVLESDPEFRFVQKLVKTPKNINFITDTIHFHVKYFKL